MTHQQTRVRFSAACWSQNQFDECTKHLNAHPCYTQLEDESDRQSLEIAFLMSRLSPLFDRFFLNQTLILFVVSSSTTVSASLILVMPGGVKIASEIESSPLHCQTLLDDLVCKWAHNNDTTVDHCLQLIKYVFTCGFLTPIARTHGLDVIPDGFVLCEDDTTFFVEAPTISSNWVELLPWLSPLQSANRRIISFTHFSIESSNGKAGKVWRRQYRTAVVPFAGEDINIVVEQDWAVVYKEGGVKRHKLRGNGTEIASELIQYLSHT